MKNISTNISYKEATFSETAIRKNIDNNPSKDVLKSMQLVADNIFQPIREHFCTPIYVSSFYRSDALNKAVNGSKNSSHIRGQAIDVDADVYNGVTNADIFYYILENLSYDQLIWEYGDEDEPNWVHFSFVSKAENRNETLIAKKIDGQTIYINH